MNKALKTRYTALLTALFFAGCALYMLARYSYGVPPSHSAAFYGAGLLAIMGAGAGYAGVLKKRDKMTRYGYAGALFICVWLFGYCFYMLPTVGNL